MTAIAFSTVKVIAISIAKTIAVLKFNQQEDGVAAGTTKQTALIK
jgi:hypothetical protein